MDIFERSLSDGTILSIVNISTAINRLAKLTSKPRREQSAYFKERKQIAVESAFLLVLLERVEREVRSNLRKFRSREISSILWSLAKLEKGESPVFTLLERSLVENGLADFTPQGLSNVCWAYATVGLRPTELFCKVEQELRGRNLADFTPQALSNLAWSFAVVAGVRSGGNLEDSDSCQDLKQPGMVWALSAIEGEAVDRGLDEMGPAALSTVAWSLTVTATGSGHFMSKLEEYMSQGPGLALSSGWGGHQLSLAVWSVLKSLEAQAGPKSAGQRLLLVLTAVAAELERRVTPLREFEPRAVSMLLSACVSPLIAAAHLHDARLRAQAAAAANSLFRMTSDEIFRRGLEGREGLGSWETVELTRLAWACAAGAEAHGWAVRPVLERVQAAAARVPAAAWTPAEMALLQWSAAAAGCAEAGLADMLEAEAERRGLSGFGPAELGRMAWSHLAAGRAREPYLRRLVAASAAWVEAGTCDAEAALQLGLAVLGCTVAEERAGMAVARGLEARIRQVHGRRGAPESSAMHR